MKNTAAFIFMMILACPSAVRAEYIDQIRQQVKETETRYAQEMGPAYFHDMGIIARKADDAELYEALTLIIQQNLYVKMDQYVEERFKEASGLMETSPLQARPIIQELQKFTPFYEPTKEFLSTANGKAMAAEMVRIRQAALAKLGDAKVSEGTLVKGFQVYQKTSLFYTRVQAEEADLQGFSRRLGCHISWSRKLFFTHEQEFKTDYEQGTLRENAELTLRTSAADENAEWSGPWIINFTGRDGLAEGVSEAVLKVKRGAYDGDLSIPAARISSSGRFNFPGGLHGERRIVSIEGTKMQPEVKIADKLISLTGCEAENPQPAKVANKNGRVLSS